MNVTELIEKVQGILQDISFVEDVVLGYLNQGLLTVAGLDFIHIPELETHDDVLTVTDGYMADLPEDYHKSLLRAFSATQNRAIKIYPSYVRMVEKCGTYSGGYVRGVAVKGSKLCYTPIPSSPETINLVYYALPTPLQDTVDEPDILPRHIGEKLLCAYACKECFDLIEDGMDGKKVNTERWENKYNTALAELAAFLGPVYTTPVETFDELGIL